MSPLPSPEERRKRLKIPGLETMAAPRRYSHGAPNRPKSAASEERDEQMKEGRRRSKAPSPR